MIRHTKVGKSIDRAGQAAQASIEAQPKAIPNPADVRADQREAKPTGWTASRRGPPADAVEDRASR